jgi:hypothetical protein
MKKVLLLFSAVVLFFSCRYDSEEEMFGLTACDTTNVRHSVEIISILQSRCFECHGGTATNGGGLQLEQYAVLKLTAQNGLLVDAITRQVNQMPKGRMALTACQIAQIRTWVRNGAPNN